jgi:hypothetical protein
MTIDEARKIAKVIGVHSSALIFPEMGQCPFGNATDSPCSRKYSFGSCGGGEERREVRVAESPSCRHLFAASLALLGWCRG